MKKVAIWLGVLLGGALLLALALTITPPQRYVDAQALRAQAEQYSANIVRDTLGVPHVFGVRDADAAFGLAYAHAEDDWKTIETTVLLARGHLARHTGLAGATTDYLVDLFGIEALVDEKFDTDLTPQTKAMLEGYAAGLNLYGLEHLAAVRPDVLPITAKDVVAGFVFRAPFFFGLSDELEALNTEQPPQTASGTVSNPGNAYKMALLGSGSGFGSGFGSQSEGGDAGNHIGSNAFAIAPQRSTDGATRLVINSHQPYSGLVAWYEVHAVSQEGWNTAGSIFPGTPVILHGFNQNLGWAHTVNKPDLTDIYILKINPKNKNQYWFDGAWKSFERSKARFRVKLWGPFSWLAGKEVLWSAHGPVLRNKNGSFAIRFSGLFEIRAVEQWYRMNKAQNFDAWRAAMAMNAIPSLNVVYGDREGNIGYFYNAKMPRRNAGFNWKNWLPGDTSDALWQGFEKPTTLPSVINPVSGFVANANNTPFRSSGANDAPNPAAFSVRYGIEHYMTNRGHRLIELLDNDALLSAANVNRIKFDLAYSTQSETARLLREIANMDFSDAPVLAQAQQLLAAWDLRTDRDNRAAALGVLLSRRCIRLNADGDPWLIQPRAALQLASDELMAHYGRLDVPWGQISRMRRGDVDVPLDGGPDILRAVYAAEGGLDAQGTLTAIAGDTHFAFVQWDVDGNLTAHTRHQFGSATANKNAPHYADQAQPFAENTVRAFPFSAAGLARETERSYHIGGN